ncbi:acetyltransferase SAS4-like domain-containing protein, partial [Aspergillus homomorphus CBS 101889]
MSARVSLPRTLDPPPPAKRARLQESSSSRRRKSSPDLLDATNSSHPRPTHIIASPSPAASSATSPHAKLASGAQSRRTSTRRPLASSNTTTSHFPPTTPRHSDRRRILRHETPVAPLPPFYLDQGRESPDPLDTISPSVSRRISPAGRTSAPSSSAAAAASSTATASSARRPRRPAPPPAPDTTPIPQKESPAAVAQRPSRTTRGVVAAEPVADSPPNARESRRSLRSNDTGARARSELAAYFPNYEEILSLEPPKAEFLTGSTTIKLIDDLPVPLVTRIKSNLELDLERPFENPLTNLHNCEVISLPEPPSSPPPPSDLPVDPIPEDPLDESIFFRAHRRNERQEKQLRNIERDRAQHEKQHFDRLLDELQGPEWLRVMGISSHTEQDKKLYEPKRDYFIREISAVLQKFKIWKEEEKRRKSDKDKPADLITPDAKGSTTTTTTTTAGGDGTTAEAQAGDAGPAAPADGGGDAQSHAGDPPDPNDVDAWAARQLLQEARSATTTTTTGPGVKRPKSTLSAPKRTTITAYFKSKSSSSSSPSSNTPATAAPPLPPPLDPAKPFTSFFADPHTRKAALSAYRTDARTPFAFGHRIPALQERDFELPPDILTPEAIDSCRRKKRRMKRAS